MDEIRTELTQLVSEGRTTLEQIRQLDPADELMEAVANDETCEGLRTDSEAEMPGDTEAPAAYSCARVRTMGSPALDDSPAPEAPAAPPDGSAGPASPDDATPAPDPVGSASAGDGDRPPRHLVRLHAWLEARFSERTRHRLGIIVGFGAAILGTLVVLVIKPLGLDIVWAAWIGLFLANWIGNGGILVPIPGLRFVGWTMAAHQGAEGPTILVGLVAGVAMALGQTSFYLTAAAGSDRLKGSGKKKERSGRLVETMQRAKATVERFLRDHGIPTIFGLSLVPNPFMTFASITAATMGMGFREFLAANFLGHVVLGLILALFGQWLLGTAV